MASSFLVSAWPIIAVDLIDSRLNLAKEFGASHTINASKSNPKVEIKDIRR